MHVAIVLDSRASVPSQLCTTLQYPLEDREEQTVGGTHKLSSKDGLDTWRGDWRVSHERVITTRKMYQVCVEYPFAKWLNADNLF